MESTISPTFFQLWISREANRTFECFFYGHHQLNVVQENPIRLHHWQWSHSLKRSCRCQVRRQKRHSPVVVFRPCPWCVFLQINSIILSVPASFCKEGAIQHGYFEFRGSLGGNIFGGQEQLGFDMKTSPFYHVTNLIDRIEQVDMIDSRGIGRRREIEHSIRRQQPVQFDQ